MKILQSIFFFFSSYTDDFERKVGLFFESMGSMSSQQAVEQKLLGLMQEDLIRVNLLLEKRFKGYRNLSKRRRKALYQKADLLKKDFLRFAQATKSHFSDKKSFLEVIRQYLKPGKRLVYQEGAAFAKLLRDPTKEKLVGDCNQMVTLYAALYSLQFKLTDLQLTVLPGHVCLHLQGKDLETTTGSWANYGAKGKQIPITELISTNLLDIADVTQRQRRIDPHIFVEASELAFRISSHRSLVEHNLKVAYEQLAVWYLGEKKFSQARDWAKKAGNQKLEHTVDHNEMVGWLDTLKLCKTLSDYKPHRHTLKKIQALAKKTKHQKVQTFCQEVLEKI